MEEENARKGQEKVKELIQLEKNKINFEKVVIDSEYLLRRIEVLEKKLDNLSTEESSAVSIKNNENENNIMKTEYAKTHRKDVNKLNLTPQSTTMPERIAIYQKNITQERLEASCG